MKVLILALMIAVIVIYVRAKRRERAAERGTVQIAPENSASNRSRIDSQTIQPRSGLPPPRHTAAGRQIQTSGNRRASPLPSCISGVESIYEFPHCPKCWANNRRGEPQKVFWQTNGGYYRCERGHRFRRNGKLIE